MSFVCLFVRLSALWGHRDACFSHCLPIALTLTRYSGGWMNEWKEGETEEEGGKRRGRREKEQICSGIPQFPCPPHSPSVPRTPVSWLEAPLAMCYMGSKKENWSQMGILSLNPGSATHHLTELNFFTIPYIKRRWSYEQLCWIVGKSKRWL